MTPNEQFIASVNKKKLSSKENADCTAFKNLTVAANEIKHGYNMNLEEQSKHVTTKLLENQFVNVGPLTHLSRYSSSY